VKSEHEPIFEALTDEQALALTLYLEARSEPTKGIIAVGSVILERVRLGYFGKGVKGVCFKPYQFSCYNSKDPQYEKVALRIASNFDEEAGKISKLQACLMIARGCCRARSSQTSKLSFTRWVAALRPGKKNLCMLSG